MSRRTLLNPGLDASWALASAAGELMAASDRNGGSVAAVNATSTILVGLPVVAPPSNGRAQYVDWGATIVTTVAGAGVIATTLWELTTGSPVQRGIPAETRIEAAAPVFTYRQKGIIRIGKSSTFRLFGLYLLLTRDAASSLAGSIIYSDNEVAPPWATVRSE